MDEKNAMLDAARVIVGVLDGTPESAERAQAETDGCSTGAAAAELSDDETQRAMDALSGERSAALLTAFWDLKKQFSGSVGGGLERMETNPGILENIRGDFHAALGVEATRAEAPGRTQDRFLPDRLAISCRSWPRPRLEVNPPGIV